MVAVTGAQHVVNPVGAGLVLPLPPAPQHQALQTVAAAPQRGVTDALGCTVIETTFSPAEGRGAAGGR